MRNTSLYVAKADGSREALEHVGPEVAHAIFFKMDWERELRIVEAAQEAADAPGIELGSDGLSADGWNETYAPEFGLTDDEERILVITPVAADTVTFWIQCPAYAWTVEKFPKSDVTTLLERYFARDDDGLQDLATQHQSVTEVALHELSEAEFQATTAGQMRWVDEAETYNQVRLRDYLSASLDRLSLPISLEAIDLTSIYRAADDRHSHILFNYGDPSRALVLVVEHDPNDSESVVGHHFLDLAAGTYAP